MQWKKCERTHKDIPERIYSKLFKVESSQIKKENEMSDKCEWKDGILHSCEKNQASWIRDHKEMKDFNYCPFCGADIRKPEPEPIIKKSGETWVARYDGVDYLWIATARMNINRELLFVKENGRLNNSFKPISEIDITDEIAKQRPMVKCVNGDEVIGIPKKLIHIVDIQCFLLNKKPINHEHYYSIDWIHINKCKLATVDDLPD